MAQILRDDLEELAAGSHMAFQKVFHATYPKVHAFALGFIKNEADAEDVVQAVFIKLWTKRTLMRTVQNMDTYLYTVTKNTVLNQLASRKATTIDIQSMKEIRNSEATALEQIEAQDLQLLIDMVVDNMPPQRQAVYKMSREEGLSNEEIAKRLGLQKKTVENTLNLALKQIREMLKILILLLLNWG
jgi:RNA polymerase sigma-70 factor (ECF subfamily)